MGSDETYQFNGVTTDETYDKESIKTAVKVQAGFQAAKAAGKELANVAESKLGNKSADNAAKKMQQSGGKGSDNGKSRAVMIKSCSSVGGQKGGC